MVIRQRVRQQPFRNRSWLIKGLDEHPEVEKRRKKHMKLILLHTCDKGDLIAINPEVVMEFGNTLDDTDGHKPDAEVRVLESQVTTDHTAVLHLARTEESLSFDAGDLISFKGMTRFTALNGIIFLIRPTASTGVAGTQITWNRERLEFTATNYSTTWTVNALGPETGYAFEPMFRIKCGFVACCPGNTEVDPKIIETKESLQEILEILKAAGIAAIHDPTNQMGKDTDIP
jgi:hypothetical protein